VPVANTDPILATLVTFLIRLASADETRPAGHAAVGFPWKGRAMDGGRGSGGGWFAEFDKATESAAPVRQQAFYATLGLWIPVL
jgi:hypothetical protein